MRRINAIAAAAALAASLTLASAGSSAEPADELIVDGMSAPATVSYTGTVEVVRIGSERSQASVYRIEHRAPGLTNRVYTSPRALSGDSVVTKGETSFSIDPKRHRIVQTENDAIDDQVALYDNYILLRANYRAVTKSTESFDGRTVYVVALVNKYVNRTIMLVRIDRDTKLVLDKQQYASDGSLVSETRFEDVRYGAAIPDSEFGVPKSLPIVRGQTYGLPSDNVAGIVRSAGFDAYGPKFLPEGFSPVEAKLAPVRGVRTLHLLYSDGIRTVSLFENDKNLAVDLARLHPQSTTIGGRDAQYVEDGTTTMLVWNDGTLRCALVGELALDELQRIAASVSR